MKPTEPSAPLYDITPFTALDYPGHLAAILWFAGCNMRCPYCYNPDIVFGRGRLELGDALDFLRRRRGLLEGVVLSGGEPTRFVGLPELCGAIRGLGFKIKLDTNGSRPAMIAELLEHGLIDAVALDFKAPASRFADVTGSRFYPRFEKTLELLVASGIPLEVRTTVHTGLLAETELGAMGRLLHAKGYRGTHYLQEFRCDTPTLGTLPPPGPVLETARIDSPLPLFLRR